DRQTTASRPLDDLPGRPADLESPAAGGPPAPRSYPLASSCSQWSVSLVMSINPFRGRSFSTSSVLLCLAGWLALSAHAARAADGRLEFNRDVRPILIDACISCHGPDSASRQADLRLDRRDDAIEMAAITPGDPDASEMIRRILSEDESE